MGDSGHGAADGNHRDHGHERDHGATGTRKLAAVSAINLVGFFAELFGGLLFGSVALLGDAFHMLFDALAYVMAFAAAFVADRYGESDQWSYGLHRLEPLAAFLNGLLLLPMVGFSGSPTNVFSIPSPSESGRHSPSRRAGFWSTSGRSTSFGAAR